MKSGFLAFFSLRFEGIVTSFREVRGVVYGSVGEKNDKTTAFCGDGLNDRVSRLLECEQYPQ